MSSEQRHAHEEPTPAHPEAPPDATPTLAENEPVLIRPGGRFWDITLPPETEAALRVSGF